MSELKKAKVSVSADLSKLPAEHIRTGAFRVDDHPCYFAKAIAKHFPPINGLAEQTPPKFAGQHDQFLEKHNGDPNLQRQLKNKVKKCANCGKPNAFTLKDCNGCGQSIEKTEISFTNNVFSGFIYGMEKAPFPLKISLRLQQPHLLVFDDLLSLTPCHFNAIPTSDYLPDFRFWLKNPKEGLKMLDELFETSWSVVKSQFLSNEEWKKVWIRDYQKYKDDDLKKHVIVGFNYPPSQYQLHIQFHLPPLLPFQYHLYLKGVHYTKGRFFPIEYARKILETNETYPVTDDTPIEEIMSHFEKKYSISYDKIHSECYERYGESHRLLANYSASHFEGVTFDDIETYAPFDEKHHLASFEGEPVEDIKNIQAKDKDILQNYGRPYSEEGKPSGSFYKHAKNFGDLKVW